MITVTARDAANNTGTDVLTVTYTYVEPSGPEISSIRDDLIDPFADYCIDSQGNTFSGYNYDVYFDYSDPNGDAAANDGAWVTVNGYYWSWATIGGDGFSGTVTVSYCSSTTGNNLTIRMYDGLENVSNQLSISLTDYP